MTNIQALILGMIQGITEFLPISSSGHLILAQSFFGFKDLEHYVLFDLVCHLGTLLAIFFVLFDHIKSAFADRKMLIRLSLALIPLFPLVILLKPIKALFDKPELLGFFFLATAFILYLGKRFGRLDANAQHPGYGKAFLIGVAQAVAICPGISRSGTTISTARILGWKPIDAFNFSFLLAIPTILGGTAVELMSLCTATESTTPSTITCIQFGAAFFTSFIFGAFSLTMLKCITINNKIHYFAWYCLALGIFALFYFH